MGWKMLPQEFVGVTKLAPRERYEYFVKKVADYEELWGLWNDGWALLENNELELQLPVWPHPDFAEAFARDGWSEYRPKLIGLDDWLEEWIPRMLREGQKVAVFPTVGSLTTTADPRRLRHDLELELERIE